MQIQTTCKGNIKMKLLTIKSTLIALCLFIPASAFADGFINASVSPNRFEDVAKWRIDQGAWISFRDGTKKQVSDGDHVISCSEFSDPGDANKSCKAPNYEVFVLDESTTQAECAYVCE